LRTGQIGDTDFFDFRTQIIMQAIKSLAIDEDQFFWLGRQQGSNFNGKLACVLVAGRVSDQPFGTDQCA